MRTKTFASAALIAAAIAMATLTADRAAPGARTPPALACSVSTTDTVPVGLKSTRLQLRYTEMIGDSITASFPPESMIGIFAVATSTMDSPPSAELTLNTEKAIAGRWKLSLKGERGVCAGDVPVVKR